MALKFLDGAFEVDGGVEMFFVGVLEPLVEGEGVITNGCAIFGEALGLAGLDVGADEGFGVVGGGG